MRHSVFRAALTGAALAALFVMAPFAGHAAVDPGGKETGGKGAKPGRMLAETPLADVLSLPGAGRSLRITYLSTDGVTGRGLVPVTGEVILPPGAPPEGGWPIVAWAHGTVGIEDSCAPSLNAFTARNGHYLSEWMRRGFAIVATDYQGLGGPGVHAYLNARAEAYSVLDSVRAALSGVRDLRDSVLIVGQSQGAGAAFAASAYAPSYAPELDIRGTVATGIPFITPQTAAALLAAPQDGPAGADPTVSYILLIGASLGGLDPHFRPQDAFTPKALPAYRAASQTCLRGLMDEVKRDGLTRANALEPTATRALAPALKAMAYPSLKLAHPLFVGTGTPMTATCPLLRSLPW